MLIAISERVIRWCTVGLEPDLWESGKKIVRIRQRKIENENEARH